LATLPAEIGPSLSKLFTPGPRTRTAHAAMMAWLDHGATTTAKTRRVVRTLLSSQRLRFWFGVGVAAVVALVFAFLLVGVPDDGIAAARFGAIAVALGLIGAGAAALLALVAEARATAEGMVAQGFGICVASDGPNTRRSTADDPGALTDWLAAHIDAIAGVDRPLRMSDLAERGIDLQVMTTNLTLGRPMRFPFPGRVFLFDPVELGAYFPSSIIGALIDGEEPATEGGVPLLSADGRPLYRLPAADKLPVVLAARISLSFPGLISAVPLYAIDFARKSSADRTAVRCWFSDGGITSNFPVHFFDSLWPRRPTFALDLRGYHPDYPEADVYYAGVRPRQPRVTRIASVQGFVSAILTTMQYWADDAQSTLPGYRDRIVEVHLHGDEGGMNLTMSENVVETLAEKGRHAAAALIDGFDFDQHRWTRYLISMARLQDAVQGMKNGYESTTPEGGGVRGLIDHAPHFAHYHRPREWSDTARIRTEMLLRFSDSSQPDFVSDVPRPETVLRITPQF
jgi:hypothetical protein